MFKSHSIRLFALALIGALMLSYVSFAADQPQVKEVKLKISSLTMSGRDRIETITNMLRGVKESETNMEKKEFTVKFDPDEMSSDMLVYTVENLGFKVDKVEDVVKKIDDKVTENK